MNCFSCHGGSVYGVPTPGAPNNRFALQTLTEETRREIAINMLQQDRYALSEIAFLTGYSEQSAFNRAFKRWMGVTPAAYRKTLE